MIDSLISRSVNDKGNQYVFCTNIKMRNSKGHKSLIH